jgi:hypothetical protein
MNERLNAECARIRARLTEETLEGRPRTDDPDALRAHLDTCPACARFAEGLAALPVPPVEGRLYTPALRARTLARLADRPQYRQVLWLVPAALVLNLFLCVALPAGLFHRVLPATLGPTVPGVVLSVLAAFGLGTATALVCAIAMKSNALKEVRHA